MPQEHLIEHVEPLERDAGLAVFCRLLVIEERLAPPDLVDDILNRFGSRAGRKLRKRIAQIGKRLALALARLAEFFRREHEVAEIMDRIFHELAELRVRLRRNARTIAPDEAPERFGILGVR